MILYVGRSRSLSNRLRVTSISFGYIRYLRPRTFFFPQLPYHLLQSASIRTAEVTRIRPPTFSISSRPIYRLNYAARRHRLGTQWCWSSRPGRPRSWTTPAATRRCCGARAERSQDERPQAHRRRRFLVRVASPPWLSRLLTTTCRCSWFHFKVCLVAGTGFFTDA